MNFHCSIGLNAAREKLRVACALTNLPKIAAAFAQGRFSYSTVRAAPRVADASNEDYLMMIAKHGSAWHVETLVQKYRGVKPAEAAQKTPDLRSVSYSYDGDGMLVIRARLPREQRALFVMALEAAMDATEAADTDQDRPESADGIDADDAQTAVTIVLIHARRADAPVELADRFCRTR